MQLTGRKRAHIVPGHARGLEDVELVADIIVDMLEVENPRVVVILSGKERAGELCRVHIRQGAVGVLEQGQWCEEYITYWLWESQRPKHRSRPPIEAR